MSFALEIRDIHFTYPDGTEALRGFSATVGEGECIGLVGPNGSGKTTLQGVLAGLLSPQSGDMVLFGETMGHDHDVKRRREIGFTFHNPDDQLFMPTVLDDVCFGPLHAGEPVSEVEARARSVLEEFGLGAAGAKFPGHLSAGQKRLATLAGVLIMNPRVLVMDEPTAFLDPFSRRQVIDHIRRFEQTRLLITHDLSMVAQVCGRVIVMSQGAAVAEGEPRDILSDSDRMARYHLEVPMFPAKMGEEDK